MPERISAHREAKQARKASRKEAALGEYTDARYDGDVLDQDRPLDDLITDDVEILGRAGSGGFFRNRYRAQADKIQEKIAPAEKIADKDIHGSRERYFRYRANRIDTKIARIEQKMTNSSNSLLSKYINNGRHLRLNELRQNKRVALNQRQKYESIRKNKPEELQRKIDKIVNKKVEAMYRKALRQEQLLDQDKDKPKGMKKKVGRYNILRRAEQKAEFIAKLAPELKKKLKREAILLARKQNIEKGYLGVSHLVKANDEDGIAKQKSKVTDDYGRIIK